jgi:hypothetical protein
MGNVQIINVRLGTTLIWIENRMEGSGCGQVLGIILVFAKGIEETY